jgi:hypothetical protein
MPPNYIHEIKIACIKSEDNFTISLTYNIRTRIGIGYVSDEIFRHFWSILASQFYSHIRSSYVTDYIITIVLHFSIIALVQGTPSESESVHLF